MDHLAVTGIHRYVRDVLVAIILLVGVENQITGAQILFVYDHALRSAVSALFSCRAWKFEPEFAVHPKYE